MVAPLHDGHIGFYLRALLSRESGSSGIPSGIETGLADPLPDSSTCLTRSAEAGDRVGPDHQIEVGNPLQKAFAFLLGHTSRHADDRPPLLFQFLESSQGAVDLMFGLLPDAAGIDEDEVRLPGLLRLSE